MTFQFCHLPTAMDPLTTKNITCLSRVVDSVSVTTQTTAESKVYP